MAQVNFVGPKNARLAIVGIAPEKNEVLLGQPFVGPSGKLLMDSLKANGVQREHVWLGNVNNEFMASGQELFMLGARRLQECSDRLKHELEELKPNCVLALGDGPTEVLTGKKGITKWAGSILPSTLVDGLKVVASVHPSWLTRGMWKWYPIFQQIYVKRAIEESLSREISYPIRNAIIGPSLSTAISYLERGIEDDTIPYVGVDIETMYWSKEKPGHIACVGIGYSKAEAICIPFMYGDGKSYWGQHEESLIWQLLARLLQSNRKKVMQNAAFEWLYFWMHSIYPSNLWIDTMLLHHCLYPDFGGVDDEFSSKTGERAEPGHGLKFLTTQFTRSCYYKDDGRNWSSKQGSIENLWRYNCQDVMVQNECAEKMYAEALKKGVWSYYESNYIKPFYHALRMEWEGIEQDLEQRKEALLEATKLEEKLQLSLNELTGQKFNVQSTTDMHTLLYKTKGYQPRKKRVKTKTGIEYRVTADKNALAHFVNKYQDKTLLVIQELKKVRDLKSDVLEQALDSNNRIHCHWKLGGTDGARWSSTKSILGTGTNLQNVPRDGIARRLFIP